MSKKSALTSNESVMVTKKRIGSNFEIDTYEEIIKYDIGKQEPMEIGKCSIRGKA